MNSHPSIPFIRPAKPGDEKGIHEAHMRSIREICVKDHGKEEIRGWGNRPLGDRWITQIQEGFVWVVENHGAIQGFSYIRIFENQGEMKAFIHGLYLTPEVLKFGFGAKLMKLMLDKAQEAGVKEVTLTSTITAHDFYRRMGFVDSGEKTCREIGGSPVTCFPMIRKL